MHYKYIDIFSGFLDDQVSQSELAAFIAYATAFPEGFLALIDTYDVIRSELSLLGLNLPHCLLPIIINGYPVFFSQFFAFFFTLK